MKGILYLIPATLGEEDVPGKSLPAYNLDIMHSLNHFIVENIRTARRFLKSTGHPVPIDKMTFFELGKHTPVASYPGFLKPVLDGVAVGLISEAGTPCVADPGADIVNIAHQLRIRVIPLVGPNSIIMALMASGFNGQQFVFHGYLPMDRQELTKKIREMEKDIRHTNKTQIFIETPYRTRKLLDTLLDVCTKQTKLCVATNLTLQTEQIRTFTISAWKKEKADLDKKPTVFLLYI
jgi:16S rRNA (cytidine1402-2'-O)-methyltransferase